MYDGRTYESCRPMPGYPVTWWVIESREFLVILGISYIYVMLLPILLLSIGGPLNKERDLYVIADATVRRRRATQ